MRLGRRPAQKIGSLGLIIFIAACASPAATSRLSALSNARAPHALIPREFLCPGSSGPTLPDPRLVREIQGFLDENGMLGGIPAGMASDLPLILNVQVQSYLSAFIRSNNFKAGLARSGRYLGMIRRIFTESGLPRDLVYLPLIESGYSPEAVSPAGAVGIWQFVEGTARRYGLKVDHGVDERRDPEKSTRAAARYLRDLYQQFGCWYLAAAGYNAGEKRVEGVMARHDSRDFWTMAEKGWLPRETCNYVPQLIAAVLIARDPAQYGLTRVSSSRKVQAEAGLTPAGIDLTGLIPDRNMSLKDLKE